MPEKQLLPDDLATEVATMLQIHHAAQKAGPHGPAYLWEASRTAARTLLRWQVPKEAIRAALLIPLLEANHPPSVLTQDGDESSLQRSLQLRSRLTTLLTFVRMGGLQAEPSAARDSLKLRRLFRWAYLDLDLVLLAMAFHDGLLTCRDLPDNLSRRLVHETQGAYVPAAEMLGLWYVRQRWLDWAAKTLDRLQQNETDYDTVRAALAGSKAERLSAFNELRSTLYTLSDKWSIDLQVRLRSTRIGSILRRYREGEPLDELTTRLTVEIVCPSEQDCYHALGLVHRLGKPVAPRFSTRFDDYIASPQPNGYQALHTAISFEYKREPGERQRQALVEFRILTDRMYQLNQWGVVEALYRSRNRYCDACAWWNNTNRLTRQLRERYRLDYTITKFVRAHELGTRPHPAGPDTCLQKSCPILPSEKLPAHPVYVFTPRGEIYLLPDSATALDFAYHLHTEIGHHVKRIFVNGRSVPFSYPLRNGDLIKVESDPHSRGPDFSWLGDVTTGLASYNIRRGLVTQAGRGRFEIDTTLLKVLQYYEREKGYRLRITNIRLDNFLLRMAKARGLPDLEALYAEVVRGALSPDRIVHRFISEELAVAIVDRKGNPIFASYPPYRISLCAMCHPVPGDPIVGRERQAGSATIGLAVHRADNDKCPGVPTPAERIPLRWAEAGSSRGHFVELEIAATDRHRLLGDVLDTVYEEAGVQLHEVNAQASDDGHADITMVISGEWDQLAHVRTRTERVPFVQNVHMRSLSLPRQLALTTPATSPSDRIPNPYTLQEVYGRSMFYDREREIDRILEWLETPPPTQLLVLHGQRRVGKTSLAKHLITERLDGVRVRPAFVDFQELDQFTSQAIADLIVRRVYEAISEPVPTPDADESPASYMSRALAHAVSKLQDYHLLVIIDEFNILMQKEEKKELDPVVFAHLRAVLAQQRDVYCMLIVQDTYFRSPLRWGGAGDLLQQAQRLPLPPLDANYARKLIEEPLTQSGCTLEGAVVEEIMALASGVPYYIHILCSELIEHMNQHKRKHITTRELNQVLPAVLDHGDRYFHHFMDDLHGLTKAVLSIVAVRQREAHIEGAHRGVSLTEIAGELEKRGLAREPRALRNAVRRLANQGMFHLLDSELGPEQVSIPIGLFRRWVGQNIDPDRVIAELNAIRERAHK